MLSFRRFSAGFCAVVFGSGCAGAPASPLARPEAQVENAPESPEVAVRLVIWVTVDQMRGDYFEKYGERLTRGGFSWLMKHGRNYQEVHYGHAITETAPGHATLFTGAPPSAHGIIANQWLLADGTEVSSVVDGETELLTSVGRGGSAGEGRSPRALLVPTVGDAMIEQMGNEARVVSISAKDRGAILPAGQRGQAYWLGATGFVTSTFYRKELPNWLVKHEEEHPLSSYLERGWSLLAPEHEYKNPPSNLSYEPKEWSRGFPHEFETDKSPASAVANSPFGDEAVMDVALAALAGESLGRDTIPDLLAISLSSTDKIGHQYGPESRELEDQLLRLDAQLGRLVERLTQFLKPGELVFVLSSDHGACESAEYLRTQGRDGLRLTEATLEQQVRSSLKGKYGHDRYFLGITSPYVSLDHRQISADRVQVESVREVVKKALSDVEGVHLAHIVGSKVPDGALGRRLTAAIHSTRSGDIYIVPERDTLLLQSDSLGATHGSPWDYDTHVPLILVGPGAPPGTSVGEFDVQSLAPTVAHLIGIKAPAAANAPLLPLGP